MSAPAAATGESTAATSASAPFGAAAAQAAARAVRGRLGDRAPSAPAAAIILGSGLGGLVERIEDAVRVPFQDVPGFPVATVVGHAGALIAGRLGGRDVVALAGRFHLYEGHPPELAGFPVRVLHALGARTLIVSNAAGGIRRTMRPGDLMRIDDHINLMWRNPLIGPSEPGEPRFPDMSAPYDRALGALLHETAREIGVPLLDGVYAGLLGPTYETPAEVRMLDRLGADAVGMSTVPEVIVARALGMRVAGVSCITNMACGILPQKLDHAEVLETTTRVTREFQDLIEGLVRRLG
ncbi:MAG TPA: purine-nucleoside phosphorylase [Gemmatimonadaceae bacterium]|nr:purine-nucleoside phosphorylase [Gemmatimonadaceae bacterium]